MRFRDGAMVKYAHKTNVYLKTFLLSNRKLVRIWSLGFNVFRMLKAGEKET